MYSSRAILLQQCGPYRWEGQYNDDWLVLKNVEVNEYLVRAKWGWRGLHLEYAERGKEYNNLFIFSLFGKKPVL